MRRLRPQKVWLTTLLVLVVAAAATGTWLATRSSSASATTTTSMATASLTDVSQTVVTSGTVQPEQQSDLSFTVSGTVTAVRVEVGQKVAKGTILATVDDTTLQSAVDTASAAVTSATEQLSSVEDSTTTQVAAATAQLAQARNELATAKDDLAAASLRAPFAGTVATVGLSVGDTVESSAGSSPASAAGTTSTSSSAITLISTQSWVVDVSVGSSDLTQLKRGQQAKITPSGATTAVFGTVASMGIVATSTSAGSATFPVVVDVTGTPAGLYAGGSADVTITVKKVPDVLTVPTSALHTEGGETVVHQTKDGKQVSTPVVIGTAYGPTTQVKSGLKEGDQVLVTATAGGAGRTGRTGGTGTGGFPAGGFPAGGFPTGGAQ